MNKRVVIILALVLTMCIVVVSCTACNFDWALGGDTDSDQTGNTDGGNTDGTGNGDTDGGDDTTPTEPTFVDKVNEFVGSLLGSRELEKVVGIYVIREMEINGEVYDSCSICATFNDGKMYELLLRYDTPVQSIEDAINNRDNINRLMILNSLETVPYDTTEALIRSGDLGYGSKIQEYIDQGYEPIIVASQGTKGLTVIEGVRYSYATVAFYINGELVVIDEVTKIVLNETSNSEENKSYNFVADPDKREVVIMSSKVVTDEWASQVLAQQSAEK